MKAHFDYFVMPAEAVLCAQLPIHAAVMIIKFPILYASAFTTSLCLNKERNSTGPLNNFNDSI